MADTKTSALSSATALTGAEQLPGVQSAASVKITATQLADVATARQHPGLITTKWYPPPLGAVTISAAVTADALYCHATILYGPATITDLGLYVVTGVAASNVKLGLYSNVGGLPTTLLSATAAIPTTASGADAKGALAASQTLGAGVYWVAALFSHTPNIEQFDDAVMAKYIGSTSAAGVAPLFTGSSTYNGYLGTGATYSGGFNSSFGAVTPHTGKIPAIAYKVTVP